MNKKIIIFDIDGTISDTSWRLHMIKEKPKNWPAFVKASQHDEPIAQTQYIFHALEALHDSFVIIMTARNENEREITETWLNKHGFKHDVLLMRKAKDSRTDWVAKGEMIDYIKETYGEIFMAFEDRPGVIKECYHQKQIYVLDVGNGTAT